MTKEKLEQIVKDLVEEGEYREGESSSYYMSEIDAFNSGFWKAVNLLWGELEDVRAENEELKQKLEAAESALYIFVGKNKADQFIEALKQAKTTKLEEQKK